MDVFESSYSDETEKEQKPTRKKIAIVFLLLLAGVSAGGYFWLNQDPARQELLTELYTDMQGSMTPPKPVVDGTQMSDGDTIPGTPEVLIAPNVSEQGEGMEDFISPPNEDGTAQQLPLEIPNDVVLAEKADTSSFVGRDEDSVVQQSFVMALAEWMVEMYEPAAKATASGRILASLQNANLRFGLSMNGIAYIGEDPIVGRTVALQYFYTPDMLKALYQLYNERFFVALEEATNAKKLSERQKKEMYTLYERRFRGLAGAFESMAIEPALSDRLALWHAAQSATVESNKAYATAVFEFDEAKKLKNTDAIQSAEKEAEATSVEYQAAIMDEAVALTAILALMQQNTAARLLDDGTLLYTALWVERRYEQAFDLEQAETVAAAVLQSSVVFFDIAKQFENASK